MENPYSVLEPEDFEEGEQTVVNVNQKKELTVFIAIH